MNRRATEMKSLVRKGHTLEWIGGKFGITRERVRQILTHNGFAQRVGQTRQTDYAMRELVAKLNAQGLSDGEIAEKTGKSYEVVAYFRNILGLKRNSRLRVCEVCTDEFRGTARCTMCPKCSRKYGQAWTHLKYQALRNPQLLKAALRLTQNGAGK